MTINIRPALATDHQELERIRVAAFTPIFDSFRNILGDKIYELAQKAEDEEQAALLLSMFNKPCVWKLFVAEFESVPIGFIAINSNRATKVGEIGLNAIDPEYTGKGFGTKMYQLAIDHMKSSGMLVATVATGADPSHLPARKAYERSGFNVQIPSVWYCRTL